MSRTYTTEAVVLKRLDYGDYDRILTLLTRERGKVSAMARGIRKPTSRLAAGLDLFAHCTVTLAEGRRMGVVTEARSRGRRSALGSDLFAVACASVAAEAAARVLEESEPHVEIFELVVTTLDMMAAGDEPERTLAHYLMRLLDFLGYRPQLRTCASCDGALVEGEAYFAPSAGGVLCPDCAAGAGDARALSTATLKVLRVLEAGDRDTYRRLRLTSALRRELSAVLRGQLEYHLDGRIRSFEFLDRIVD